MEDLRKINSMQLYYMWRNLAISLLSIGITIGGSHMIPFYMAPALSLLLCGILYAMIWNNSVSDNGGCMVVVETVLYSLLGYTFLSVLIVLVELMGLYVFPKEIVFFNDPFLPSLILIPTSFAMTLFAIFFRNSMPSYRHFRTQYGNVKERGYFGFLANKETGIQLKNMAVMFGVLTIIIWWYYLNVYVNVNRNGRDWYIFLWIIIIAVIIDECYFMMRYYNLYLDLQEHNEIITPEELRDVTAHTYLRFYVVCGEYVFIDRNAFDRLNQVKGVFDTPFITKRTVNGIPTTEVRNIVERMSGKKGGELRFFFGRHLAGVDKHSLLRYFYFLDGDISDHQDMAMDGEWIPFSEIKKVYSLMPNKIASNALGDLSRLSTIILTERIYNEDGTRKNKIKSYKGSLTLEDVRKSNLDFQDDKWINIANFNSDTKFFKLKKFLRELSGKNSESLFHRKG